MIYKLRIRRCCRYWPCCCKGLIFTLVLTVVSTVGGIAVGTAGAWARTFGPEMAGASSAAYVELIRNTPFIVQLFFIFFGLPALGVKLSPEPPSSRW
jgi:polar amino acid transport system permease protein